MPSQLDLLKERREKYVAEGGDTRNIYYQSLIGQIGYLERQKLIREQGFEFCHPNPLD